MTNATTILSFLVLGTTVTACGSEAYDPVDGMPHGPRSDDPDSPAPEPEAPPLPDPAPDGAATYEVVSTFDVPVSTLLPGPAYDAVETLGDFRDDPGATLFTILDEAGVPGAGELRDALPGPVQDELDAMLTDAIESAEVGGTPASDHLDFVLAQSELVLGRFDVVSDLALSREDKDGALAATHRVRALRIPAGGPVELELPEDPSLDAVFTLEQHPDASVEDGTELVLGDHSFGLPYGEHAWMALDLAMHEAYGTDLRGALGEIVDCGSIAASVADQCILGLCVGHEQELTALCEQGLDLLVDEMHAQFSALRFDAIRLAHGQATLADGPVPDGRADALVDGVWQASLDLGQGPREVPATFTGTRAQ